VLWQWAGGGLHLPRAKSPSTVARGVTLFGPESYCQGSGSLVLGVGVGRGKWRLHRWVCTPPRKIRARFRRNKHTSLIISVGESRAFGLLGLENEPRNVCRNALETVVL
jgi:hypothetical protein